MPLRTVGTAQLFARRQLAIVSTRLEGCKMTGNSPLDTEAASELHNRVARQIVSQILNVPIAAGGSISDVLVILESVLVGVVVECFKLGHDGKVIDLIFTAAKARLAKVRLEDLEAKGSG
jgi:hypothetical protein